jgi:hypothetical protein
MENKKSMIVAVATSRVVQKEETEAEVAPAAEGEEPAAEQAGA